MTELTQDQSRRFHDALAQDGSEAGILSALRAMSNELFPAPHKLFPALPGIPVLIDRHGLEYEANEVIDKVLKKNRDYGDAWQALGKVGAAARFVDKLFRIEHLTNGQEALVVDEKLEDTVADMVGYGLLILMYKREKG